MRHVLLILVSVLVLAPSGARGADQLRPPPRDLVHLQVHVTWATGQPGGANEGSCFVANATAGPVRVRLDASVQFSDGNVQRLTGLPDPGVLDPGGAFDQSIFFVIPADAPLGPAWFVCDVRAQAPGGAPERELGGAAFEVVP